MKLLKKTNYLLILVLAILIFVSGFILGRSDAKKDYADLNSSHNYVLTGDIKGEYKQVNINVLWEVWDDLSKIYLRKNIDGNKLLDGAIKGLVKSLDDPYTAYLNEAETKEYLKSNSGKFEGVGMTLKYNGQYTEVETPIEGLPAYSAGIKAGDLIMEVDGKDVVNKNAYEVAMLIRGEAGTNVHLKILRDGENDPIEFDITRAKIDLDSISYEQLDDGIFKIKITQFTESSISEFNSQWDEIAKEIYSKNPDKIIVDLRNNPGGFVDSVRYVLDEFLPRGTLLFSERDRNGNMRSKKAIRNGRFEDVKLVVLVNEASASSAEIFAGAIQDNHRGQIIGMPTVGKGVEQQIINLSNKGTLHIVFQEWVLPSGRTINKDDSIHPDIEVELTKDDFINDLDPQLDKAIEFLQN